MYSSCMADIETLSTESNALVISAAFVLFDIDSETEAPDDILNDSSRWLLVRPDQQAQAEAGLHIDPNTVKWWVNEVGRQAQVDAFAGGKSSVTMTMADIQHFFINNDDVGMPTQRRTKLWGNGAPFDNVILRNFFKTFDATFPVPFWNDADLRTLEYLARTVNPNAAKAIKDAKPGVEHSALSDAVHQVICAQEYYKLTRFTEIV